MHSETHHVRTFFVAVLLALLALMMFARPARSAWGTDPVQVDPTSGQVPLVSACEDGHFGAIVVWQQQDDAGSLLEARHLLANGGLDPVWAGAVTVSTMSAARTALGAVTDRAGGAYVWWMESNGLFLTRIAANGAVAGGWPARGRTLGSLSTSEHRPSIAADGAGGIYAVWIASSPFQPAGVLLVGAHLGPANTPLGGWPSGGRALGATTSWSEFPNTAAISAAPDGGLWLAFSTTVLDQGLGSPGDVRLVRLTAAGTPSPGWDAHGVSLGAFHGDLLMSSPGWLPVPRMNLIAVTHDGTSGAYVLGADMTDDGYGNVSPYYFVNRVDGTGLVASGWPAGGFPFSPSWGVPTNVDAREFASLRALPDGHGGAFLGAVAFGSEGASIMQFGRIAPNGSALPGGVSLDMHGVEAAIRGDGGMFAASYYPSGPNGPWSPNAYISVRQSEPGIGFLEYSSQPLTLRYGDIGLAATGDGGAIFVWSQYVDRQGVFAVRIGPEGAVAGVTPTLVPVGPPSLRLRFVPNVGVRALISSLPPGRGELSLYDAAGRLVASTHIGNAGVGDRVFPGTERLPSGLYFARAAIGEAVLLARVAVTR